MNWQDLAAALALVVIIEGLLPLINPDMWKNMLKSFIEVDNKSIRNIGLVLVLVGSLFLYLVRGW